MKRIISIFILAVFIISMHILCQENNKLAEKHRQLAALVGIMNYNVTYSIGGTVSGLAENSGQVGLELNTAQGETARDSETIYVGSGTFVFSKKYPSGSGYEVLIKNTPNGYECTISNESGTLTQNVDNILISCSESSTLCPETADVTYSWGSFTDCKNGTVKFVGNAGNFGGVDYSAVTLYFEKCTHGQTYEEANNNCQGSGSSGDNYSATKVSVCTDNSVFTNAGCYGVDQILNGSGTSAAYSACDAKETGSFSDWRVPTKAELKLLIKCTEDSIPNDSSSCTGSTSPAIVSLFTETIGDNYWTSEYGYTASSDAKYKVNFDNGNTDVFSGTTEYYLRCVRTAQ